MNVIHNVSKIFLVELKSMDAIPAMVFRKPFSIRNYQIESKRTSFPQQK